MKEAATMELCKFNSIVTKWIHLIVMFMIIELENVSSENVTLCPLLLRSVCSCDSKNLITNCTSSNITDITWLHDIPIETKQLILTGNDMPKLPRNVFGFESKQIKPLEYLDLSNNKIQLIDGESLHGFKLVKKLILNNNQILITGKNRKD